eukprot:scaffold33275_cov76-Phaeocystis_antarctica.AAC.6
MPSSNSSRPRSVFLGGLITPTFCSAFWIAFFCPLSDRAQGKQRIRRFASDQRLASSNGGRSHGVPEELLCCNAGYEHALTRPRCAFQLERPHRGTRAAITYALRHRARVVLDGH